MQVACWYAGWRTPEFTETLQYIKRFLHGGQGYEITLVIMICLTLEISECLKFESFVKLEPCPSNKAIDVRIQ